VAGSCPWVLSFHPYRAQWAPRPITQELLNFGLGEFSVTIDEELTVLESQLRRLKIEYEVYFSNPTKRPPTDIEWKVLSLLRKFSDGGRMSFSQRFRYNEMAQRYAVYSDLWRKKGRIREEGYRRPQDALLSVSGVRVEEHEPEHKVYGVGHAAAGAAAATAPATVQAAGSVAKEPLRVECSDARTEQDKVATLYKALSEAKKNAGEAVSGNMESFSSFVQKKTDQIRKQYGCQAVEYSVEMEGGQVRLKAKAKV
jgi:hypothetical protein